MKLSFIHYVSFAAAIIISLIPIAEVTLKVKTSDDYSVGGRKYGLPMVMGAVLCTLIGGASTVGTAQMAFTKGLTAWWVTLGSGTALLAMAFFYAKPLRRSKLTTVSQFLTNRYGKKAGAISSIMVSIGMFFGILTSTIPALHLISGIFGLSFYSTAALIVFLVLSFVFFGGIKGSGAGGLVKLCLVSISIVAGGIWAFYDMGYISGMKQIFAFDPWLNLYSAGVVDGIYNLTCMFIGVLSTQAYVQGLFAAKNLRTAYWGCLCSGITIILVGLPSVIIGMFMRHVHPEILPINALPNFLCEYLPPYIGGAGLAAILFSTVGSISGLSLGIGTTLSNDVFKNLLKINNEKKLLLLNRLLVLLITLTAIALARYYYESLVLRWNYLSMALRGIAIFIPLTVLIFFRKYAPAKAGVPTMLAAIFFAVFWKIIFPESHNVLFPGLIASLFIIVPLTLREYLRKHQSLNKTAQASLKDK